MLSSEAHRLRARKAHRVSLQQGRDFASQLFAHLKGGLDAGLGDGSDGSILLIHVEVSVILMISMCNVIVIVSWVWIVCKGGA